MFIFLMALFFIANTASRLLIRVFAQKTQLDPYHASLAILLPSYLFGVVYGLSQQEQPLFEGFTPMLALMVLFMGVAQVVSGKVSMITQKHIETASFMVIRSMSTPASVMVSTLFLGEGLTLPQFLGMVGIVIGAIAVSTGGKAPHIKHVGRYELLTLANAVFMGTYVVFNRFLIEQTSLSTLLVVFAGIELTPLLVTIARRPLIKPTTLDIRLSLGIGIASVVHIIAFWLAVELVDNVALVSSLVAFRVVTVFAGSYFILGEKSDIRQKVIGSIMATAGCYIIS